MIPTIHLFRYDLRVHDNPSLLNCLNYCSSSSTSFLPLYAFDPVQTSKMSPRRLAFLHSAVTDLSTRIPLQCIIGDPVQYIKTNYPKSPVYLQSEPCRDETLVSAALDARETFGSALIDVDDLPFPVEDCPTVFTPFRNKVEKASGPRSPLPAPDFKGVSFASASASVPPLSSIGVVDDPAWDARSALPPTSCSGETAGLERLRQYVWEEDRLKSYFDTRNGLIGPGYSTKLSPYLALGCISPRKVCEEVRRYEGERVENKSTYWVIFELLVRDFCKFSAFRFKDRIFSLTGTLGRDAHGSHHNSVKWGYHAPTFQRWRDGMTGFPFVDAAMRELKATGYMSNRSRQNVASFLALDMRQDWRKGADHFEEHLLDYDIYSNWWSWAMAAGMTGGRVNKFNVVKQGKDYDPDGEYVRLWCPELLKVPKEYAHEPWRMSKEVQKEVGCVIGVDYPDRVVEIKAFQSNGGGRGKGGKQGKNKRKEKYKGGSYRVIG